MSIDTTEIARLQAEASVFAFALLMPRRWLIADLERIGGIDIEDDKKLAMFAKRYRVSPQVMAIRIGQLYGR